MKTSSGILLYKSSGSKLMFFLVHPGGPFWKNKDNGAWSIPKGEVENGEGDKLFEVAKRELFEETGIRIDLPEEKSIPLGEIKQKSGKVVHCWALEKNFDGAIDCKSKVKIRNGDNVEEFPEVDKGGFFDFKTAEKKINHAQFEFIERVVKSLDVGDVGRQQKLF